MLQLGMVEELALVLGLVVVMDLTLQLVEKELERDIQLLVLVLALARELVNEQLHKVVRLLELLLDKGNQLILLQESIME